MASVEEFFVCDVCRASIFAQLGVLPETALQCHLCESILCDRECWHNHLTAKHPGSVIDVQDSSASSSSHDSDDGLPGHLTVCTQCLAPLDLYDFMNFRCAKEDCLAVMCSASCATDHLDTHSDGTHLDTHSDTHPDDSEEAFGTEQAAPAVSDLIQCAACMNMVPDTPICQYCLSHTDPNADITEDSPHHCGQEPTR